MLARLMKTYGKVNVQVAAYTDNNRHIERQRVFYGRAALSAISLCRWLQSKKSSGL